MRKKIIAGNWKMHGNEAVNTALLSQIIATMHCQPAVDCIIIPPFVYLTAIQQQLIGSGIKLGAQNVSEHPSGAYTGEIAAAMLRDVGCDYVLVGHSERRTYYHETNPILAQKFQVALSAGLQPILCVGETLAQREHHLTTQVVLAQLDAILNLADGVNLLAQGVIAYEPVWAIGTGKTATPQQAQEVHHICRSHIAKYDEKIAEKISILYGGSVKSGNSEELFAMPDIDGGLIGGAALHASEFVSIYQAAG